MITKEQYDAAIAQKEAAQVVINQYHLEYRDAFKARMEDNPIFTDDELVYAATTLCPCGYGMAYPKTCGPDHYWECAAILKGIAQPDPERHADRMPFMMYDMKSESQTRGTTRGVYRPRPATEE